MRNIRFTAAIAALGLAIPLAACGSDPAPAEHGEEGAEAEKGPNGGRLLKDGDFAVEVTVFETGQEPQFRVYATRGGEPVDPGAVQLTMILRRLGGEVNTFAFKPEGKCLAGQGVVEEPHSFDVWSRLKTASAMSGNTPVQKAAPVSRQRRPRRAASRS